MLSTINERELQDQCPTRSALPVSFEDRRFILSHRKRYTSLDLLGTSCSPHYGTDGSQLPHIIQNLGIRGGAVDHRRSTSSGVRP